MMYDGGGRLTFFGRLFPLHFIQRQTREESFLVVLNLFGQRRWNWQGHARLMRIHSRI
jgi:hypothetical protein